MHIKKMMGLTVLSSAIIGLSACGGGGGDDKNNYIAPPSLTPTQLAQVAASIQTAKTTFNVVTADGESLIEKVITENKANRDIACQTGSYKVIPNIKTPYNKDGLLTNSNCNTKDSQWDGAVDLECLDNSCNKSITTATGASWLNRKIQTELAASGEVYTDNFKEGYKGQARITIAGKSTRFDFADVGLVQEYYNNSLVGGFGVLKISNGRNTRCIDGTYAYDVRSNLATEEGSLRVIGGEMKILDSRDRELGTVRFARDGGVNVRTHSGETASLSPNEFESYCGLAEAYRFSIN